MKSPVRKPKVDLDFFASPRTGKVNLKFCKLFSDWFFLTRV
jgi:hypothetical protein